MSARLWSIYFQERKCTVRANILNYNKITKIQYWYNTFIIFEVKLVL